MSHEVYTTSSEDGPSLATIFLSSNTHKDPFHAQTFPSIPSIRTWLTSLFNRISNDQYLPPMGKPLLLKAVNPATEQIAGFALWRLPADEEMGVSMSRSQGIQGPWCPDVEEGVCERYFNVREKVEREVMRGCVEGKEYYSVEMLLVHPDFEGKGVEQDLLDWGVEQAVMEGAPVLAVTTKQQKGLYEKNGFKMKRTEEVADGYERVYMVRSGRR